MHLYITLFSHFHSYILQCVRVFFEIGHEASLRNKKTEAGYTHDWEIFVRGADNVDIHHFIEKVVFNLHKTFSNPKRSKSYLNVVNFIF